MWNFPLFISAEKDMMLKLRGAYKEDCLIPGSEENPSCTQTIRYYINRDLETEFSLIPPKVCHWLNWWFPILINLSSMYFTNRWECIMPLYVFACLVFIQAGEEVDGINPKIADILSSVPIKLPLPAKQQIKLSMSIGQVVTGKIN